ncbi:hypothetical protein HYX18_04325 [Candidatus Woesearchaeota archaeon]|nr:hypothetical protein [Candidatus Woesearchaeota archaeon]
MKANLKCPYCKEIDKVHIPKDICLPFHKCSHCNKIITAKKECCVICEFSDKKCPVYMQ